MRRILLLLAVLLLAAPGWTQETCTSTQSDDVSSAADAASWTGTPCTPSPGDHFVVASGHVITQTGNFLATTGSVTIEAGGRWRVGAGQTLGMPDGHVNVQGSLTDPDGNGVLEANGAKLAECIIKLPIDYDQAGDYRIDLDCDTTGFTTNDFVVVADEDPSSLTAPLTGAVQYGAGRSGSKVNRPSYDKWRWYPIAAVVDGDTLDIEPNHAAIGVAGTPYAGTYGVPAATTITTGVFTRGYGGTHTTIAIDEATEGFAVCGVESDFGSRYVTFPDTYPAAATSSCSGLMAKVLHCDDETTAGTDTLYVAGDLSDCPSGPSAFDITNGLRRGDKVYVVRPAILNGDHDADNAGEGALNQSGGTVVGSFFRILKPGFVDRTSITPTMARHCNWCIHQGEGASAAEPAANVNYFEIASPEYQGVADTGAVYMVGSTQVGGPRFPVLADFPLLNIERGYVHDQRNNVIAGGIHGVYVDTATGFNVHRMRVERMSDDGMGGGHRDENSIWDTTTTFRHYVVTESLASTANSQQGVEFVTLTSAAIDYVTSAGIWELSDIMAVGSYDQSLQIKGLGSSVTSSVVGGSFNATPLGLDISGSGSAFNVNGLYPNKVDNTFAFMATGATSAQPNLGGILDSSLMIFAFPSSANNRLWQANQIYRSYFLSDLAAHRFEMVSGSGISKNENDVTFIYTEDVISICKVCDAFMWNYASADGYDWSQTRVFHAGGNLGNPGAVGSAAASHSGILTGPTNGFVMTEAAGANSLDAEALAGQTLTNVCVPNTTGDLATVFNGKQTDTTRTTTTDAAGPQADIDAPLRAFLQVPGNTDPCNLGRPTTVGWRAFSVTHGLLGDFVIRESHDFSSLDLITPVGASSGGGGGVGGGGGLISW